MLGRRVYYILASHLIFATLSNTRICIRCAVSAEMSSLFSAVRANKEINNIINCIASWQRDHMHSIVSRPFVLVSYAQSFDGRIALPSTNIHNETTSSNFPISGSDSLRMTHAIRSVHDGVMVGGRTLLIDNPRLSNRLWNCWRSKTHKQPRPIVLDANLEAIEHLAANIRMKNPIICCNHRAAAKFQRRELPLDLLPCFCTSAGMLDLEDVLAQLLLHHSIKSIMVEGGASVISSFFDLNLVDAIVITIAPKLCRKGLMIESRAKKHPPILDLATTGSKFRVLGTDVILLSRFPKEKQ